MRLLRVHGYAESAWLRVSGVPDVSGLPASCVPRWYLGMLSTRTHAPRATPHRRVVCSSATWPSRGPWKRVDEFERLGGDRALAKSNVRCLDFRVAGGRQPHGLDKPRCPNVRR